MKTWWYLKTWWKPGESLMNSPGVFYFWWKLAKIKIWWIHHFFLFWWKPGELFQNLVTWWKPGDSFKQLGENLVNWLNLDLVLVKTDGILVNLQNLVKSWWMPKPGENLVKTWWIHQVFTKQTKEAFCALKGSGKTLVAFHTRNSIMKTLVAFQN